MKNRAYSNKFKKEVFIIDDDAEFFRQISFAFRRKYECVNATSTREALRKYPRFLSPVIFLDLVFDDSQRKTGLDIIPKLKEINPLVEIIVVSSDRASNTIQSAIRLGASHFLVKDDYDVQYWMSCLEEAFMNYSNKIN